MSAKAESRPEGGLDGLKWLVSLAVLGGSIVGFYYFSQESVLLRVIALLACFGIAAAIALRTAKGRFAVSFARDTQIEVRKVVWPTRQETVQTTLIVIVMVIIIALMIWAVDSILFWVAQKIAG